MEAKELLGREQELAAVGRFLATLADGPAVLLLEGEPGIGKTALVECAVEEARGRGDRILAARPTSAERSLSFVGLTDLLSDVREGFAELPSPQRSALEVALLLDESTNGPPDPRAIGMGLLGVLRALAASEPVLVAVDDLQWLDQASAAALSFAFRRVTDEPIGLLAALRRGAGAAADFGDERVSVGSLSVGAIHALLAERLQLSIPRSLLLRIHDATRGNPLFALEIGRALQEHGLPEPGAPFEIATHAKTLFTTRLAQLPPDTLDALAVAAASAAPSCSLVRATSAGDLEPAIGADVIRLESERIHFTHPLLASSVYGRLDPATRRELHRRIATVVADSEERARHLALAADAPNGDVAAALDEAAEHAARRGASLAAAELWETACPFIPPGHDDEQRRYRLAAGNARLHAADLIGARALFERLVAETPAGAERAAFLLQLAMTRDDDLAAMVALCKQALREAGDDAAIAAQIHRLLALGVLGEGRLREALAQSRQAVQFAETVGEPALLAVALAFTAQLENFAGDITPGLLDRALALEQRLESLRASYESPSTTLGCWLMYRDRLDEARMKLDGQVAKATAAGDELTRSGLLMHQTELECRAGNWERADELASECFELYERRGLELQGSVPLYARALVDAHLGRVDECRAACEQGLAIADTVGDTIFAWQLHGVLGFLELSLGALEAAALHLRNLPAELVALGWNEPTVYPVWPNTIEALIGLGEVAQAHTYLEQYEQRAQAYGSPWALATAARCRGLFAAADGDLEAARAGFRHALAEHERTGPFERARTLLAAGRTERRAGRRRDARAALDEALATFDDLRAKLWVEQARAELARLGGRTPSAHGLTGAEERVARLVAEGKTNREVAAALFVTERTVETHLSSIYRKLELRSRSELAGHLAGRAS